VSPRQCIGIFRERAHSPGREFDDAEILRLTAKHLEDRGFSVALRDPEEMRRVADAPRARLFLMCERPALLGRLRRWERAGVVQVNAPSAVLNTYRERMIRLWRRAGVPFPRTVVVSTAATEGDLDGDGPTWVKRADVHNTQEGDVLFAAGRAAALEALGGLAARGIPRAVLQEPIAGDLIKFYGVGDPHRQPGVPPWFRWFYHRDQRVAGYPFAEDRLAALAQRAAAALGLEIYGGDAIVGKAGGPVLIDLNAWPSFALYRNEASERIAAYLAGRFGRRGGGR